jgi:hypothetical protein
MNISESLPGIKIILCILIYWLTSTVSETCYVPVVVDFWFDALGSRPNPVDFENSEKRVDKKGVHNTPADHDYLQVQRRLYLS